MVKAVEHEHRAKVEVESGAIDCDVHEQFKSIQDLVPYLAREWQDYIRNETGRVPIIPRHPYVVPMGGTRRDAIRPDGTKGSQHLDQIQWQLLDKYHLAYAILTGEVAHLLAALPQQQFACALASAYNDWLIENLLPKDSRLKGSIGVASQSPDAAAREIDRVGDHPDMVQVILPIASPSLPWGDERYYPMWEAAQRHNLPLAFHVIAPTGLMGVPNGAGWPRTYMELRSQYTLIFQAQLISIVCSGMFEKFPGLKVVFLEGGFSWLPSVMWRLDQSWRSLRAEVPWLKRKPSEYIKDHCRFGTQPFEEADDPNHVLQIMEMIDGENLLMFATDYPHWDFDSPERALPRQLSESARRKILWENATDFYHLPVQADHVV